MYFTKIEKVQFITFSIFVYVDGKIETIFILIVSCYKFVYIKKLDKQIKKGACAPFLFIPLFAGCNTPTSKFKRIQRSLGGR